MCRLCRNSKAYFNFIFFQLKNMEVKPGEVYKEDPLAQKKQESQEYRLRVKMIPKKHKKLYKNMMKGQDKRKKEIWLLRKKRRLLEEAERQKKKESKKSLKSAA